MNKIPILVKCNLKCNFRCKYCYQNSIRRTGYTNQKFKFRDIEKTIRELCKRNNRQEIVIHGGEPLTMRIRDLEKFFRLSYELTGRSSLQTNGYLITGKHIELFKRYKTSVGISIDGPYPCNELRGIGSEEDRKKQTNKIIENIKVLREENIPVSVIIVAHKANAIGKRRAMLKNFILFLDSLKVSGRLNPCCSNDPSIQLTPSEAADFYSDMFWFMLKHGITGWSPFRDIINSLKGSPNVVCVFSGCDPLCTQSAISILPDGSLGVCLRLYKDGIPYLRDRRPRSTRTDLLRETDCKGCEWFEYCHGGCSGMAINDDWRNKDRFCEAYKAMFRIGRNILRMAGVQLARKRRERYSSIEHVDGDIRHLDSSILPRHTDNICHLDGGLKHLDSNLIQEHADGIEHIDRGTRHLDSDVRW